MLLKLRKGCPDILSDTMAESLRDKTKDESVTDTTAESFRNKTNDELVKSIRQFNYFWKELSADTENPDNLPEIF